MGIKDTLQESFLKTPATASQPSKTEAGIFLIVFLLLPCWQWIAIGLDKQFSVVEQCNITA